MRIKKIIFGVVFGVLLVAIGLTGCFAKKFAQKKVENEELKIKLAKAESDLRKLDGIITELKEVGTNTDTIVLHTTEIKEVVRESKTTLDTISRKIDAIQKDITEIKRRLQ